MTNLVTKLRAALSNAALFTATLVMACLGFAFVGTLALFVLLAVGIAMICAPFATDPASKDKDWVA
ncbi:MAG: hypothetical protein AAF340_05185 [Pseudomonadota bacterium]